MINSIYTLLNLLLNGILSVKRHGAVCECLSVSVCVAEQANSPSQIQIIS